MQPTEDQKKYILPEKEQQEIFEDIWLDATGNSTTADYPVAVFLGGQPGSGKSGLARYHLDQFAAQGGGMVLVNSDALREYHPAFESLQRTDADRASFLVQPAASAWQQKMISAAVGTKYNLLLDGTLGGDSGRVLGTIQWLRQAGYRIEVSVLSVPAYQSRLGIYKRYVDQVAIKGHGRWVGMSNHDKIYGQLPEVVALLEAQKACDQLTIFPRLITSQPSTPVYQNQLANGEWESEPKAKAALETHRGRLLTYAEYKVHQRVTQEVQWQLEQTDIDVAIEQQFAGFVKQTAVRWRTALPTDVQLYYNWANDHATRRQSFRSEPIAFATHKAWFTQKVNNADARLLIFEDSQNVPLGQVRFERKQKVLDEIRSPRAKGITTQLIDVGVWDEAVISISVDANFRGKGLASILIEEACLVLKQQKGNVPITAYIKPDNRASVRAFERSGFRLVSEAGADPLRLVKDWPGSGNFDQ